MKKYFKLLFCAALGIATFTACEDVPEPYNIPTESGSQTPTATEVTCAEAVELVNALASGATSTEQYAITGYITQVVGDVSLNQQTFWMADTKDGGKVFEAYWANLPEGVEAFKQGMKVKITGYLTKYVNSNSGTVTAEIKNANVEILEDGGGDTPVGAEVTCAQAVEIAKALADNATSAEAYAVTGYITEIVGNVSRNQQTFWMADTKDGENMFEASWADLPEGVEAFTKGSKVKLTGSITKYIGKDGSMTAEIKNGKVVILELGSGETPAPQGEAKGSGTLEDPYNAVAAAKIALALENKAVTEESYYIKGKIATIKYSYDVEHGTATFFISDDGTTTDVFQVYSALFLGNKSWKTGNTQIKVGDEVIVYGKITNYDGTPETSSKNAYLYSLNGKTEEEVPGGGEEPTPGKSYTTLADFNNGGFETWADGVPAQWQSANTASTKNTVSQSTDAHSGTYSVQVAGTTSGNNRLASTELTLEAGDYTMEFYVKPVADGGSVRPGYVPLKDDGSVGSYLYGDYVNDIPAGQWTKVTHTFNLSATTNLNLVIMNPKKPGQNFLIDDFTITKSEK